MMRKKRLNREKQCKNCPWRVDADLSQIPGYSEQQHVNLQYTISKSPFDYFTEYEIRAMACHCSPEHEPEMCVGWLINQLGEGNNIQLRLYMRHFYLGQVEAHGEQYSTLQETIDRPKGKNK